MRKLPNPWAASDPSDGCDGLTGGFGYLPWTVGHFFADSLGVPLAILICGIALLAATLVVLRRGRKVLKHP